MSPYIAFIPPEPIMEQTNFMMVDEQSTWSLIVSSLCMMAILLQLWCKSAVTVPTACTPGRWQMQQKRRQSSVQFPWFWCGGQV